MVKGGKFAMLESLKEDVKTSIQKDVLTSRPDERVTAYIEADVYDDLMLFVARNKREKWNLKRTLNAALREYLKDKV